MSPLLATVGCLEITRKGQSLMSTLSLHDGTLISLTFRSPRGRVVHDYPLSQTTTILGCSAAPTNKRIISAGLVDCSPPFLEGWGGLQDYHLSTQPLPSPGGGKLALIPHGQGEGPEYLGSGGLGRRSSICVGMRKCSSLLGQGFPDAALLERNTQTMYGAPHLHTHWSPRVDSGGILHPWEEEWKLFILPSGKEF